MNKRFLLFIPMVLFIMPLAFAQEGKTAGITPDNKVMWGLDIAMERIQMALTLNSADKAKLGLEHALERLEEVKLMILENKQEAMEKAIARQNEDLEDVEKNILNISKKSDADELMVSLDSYDKRVEESVWELNPSIKISDSETSGMFRESQKKESERVKGLLVKGSDGMITFVMKR